MIETWILTNGERAVSVEVETARSWWARFKGLMLRAPLDEGRGLYLEKTNSIHMCFMRFAIDAVYFDGEGRVVKVVLILRRGLASPPVSVRKGVWR